MLPYCTCINLFDVQFVHSTQCQFFFVLLFVFCFYSFLSIIYFSMFISLYHGFLPCLVRSFVTSVYIYAQFVCHLFFVLSLCLGFATCHGCFCQFCTFMSYTLYVKCGKVIYSFCRGLCGKIARVVGCQSRMKCQPARGPLSRLVAHLFRVLGNR